ncbi:MAG: GNAT family N-acetyltransferase [Bacteroidota bacterium]
MSLTYRKLESTDVAAYRALRLECLLRHADLFGTTVEEESAVAELKFEKFLKESNSENFMFGAFNNNELIGIVGFERLPRIRARHKGELVQMYIRREYTGQGTGTALVNRLIDACFSDPSIEEIKLSVIADNITAVKFYEKMGFSVFAVEKNYFKRGITYSDQLFMKLTRPC